MKAKDIMTSDPKTIAVSETVLCAWDTMNMMNIRHLPVVKNGRVIGMLSRSDLLGFDIQELGGAELDDRLKTPIANIFHSEIISVKPDQDVSSVIDIMIEEKIGALLVIDENSESLEGIISYLDILEVAKDKL